MISQQSEIAETNEKVNELTSAAQRLHTSAKCQQ
jgi:hypothetical protein